MATKLKKPFEHYAKKYGVNKGTISRWVKAGLDVENPEAIAAYRAAKTHGGKNSAGEIAAGANPGTRIKPGDASAPLQMPTGTLEEAAKLEGGAAAALQRLEDAEKQAYIHVLWAMESKDAFAIKAAREGWLKLGDSLRRYDATIEATRREAGALLAKADAERMLKVFAYYLRIAGRQLVIGAARKIAAMEDPAVISGELESILGEEIMLATASLIATSEGKMEVPGWVGDALNADRETFFADAKLNLDHRVAALREVADAITKGTK